ncbi:DUF4329 domain-containing protein [Pseudohalocynthiibacter aestuariivivens]|uniref:DUF4329 domain-containing protein n=1 Tax=Pseudohalocynthiibacter aestuariivivens TaxID=1591409 RepID=A0ABV5JIQ5_9RHOB|nr:MULTISPECIES: DUF4329 domain-containing protein [Pseudohalocynthiibacter]MBS9716565.1 DUF4329 domain-containing protein [Pseudohalocynthiibacter aestuariivivens]MCK0101635.1 DUF4329 domain-containing protein [Pseudohalocynthiibacter sp. F2068]
MKRACSIWRSTIAVFAVLMFAVPTDAKNAGKLAHDARYATEHQFVLEIFQTLNQRSVEIDREFCGFLYYDGRGQIAATRASKGGTHSCMPVRPDGDYVIFSSYHTHAAYDPNSLNEYPSAQDVEGDFANRHNGYVATPGGRLWFIDFKKQIARQICDYRCLPFDSSYREPRRERPKSAVTLHELQRIIDREFGS